MSVAERIKEIGGWLAMAGIVLVSALFIWPDLPGMGWLRDRVGTDTAVPTPAATIEHSIVTTPPTTAAPSTEANPELSDACAFAILSMGYAKGFQEGSWEFHKMHWAREEVTFDLTELDAAVDVGIAEYEQTAAEWTDEFGEDISIGANYAAGVGILDAVYDLADRYSRWELADLTDEFDVMLNYRDTLRDDTAAATAAFHVECDDVTFE